MIQITFTPENERQVAAVAQAMAAYFKATPQASSTAQELVAHPDLPTVIAAGIKADSAKKRKAEPAVAKDSASATGEAEVPNATPTDSPTASTASSPERITLEDIRGVLAKLSQGGKAAEVKGLIAKFNAAKLTEISADKYAEVLAAAKEL